MSVKNSGIPTPSLRRLPVYHRVLEGLKRKNTERVSSRKLSQITGFTASQIRQDISFVCSVGQQGYGYNVDELYMELSRILKTTSPIKAVLIGAGNLGKAVATSFMTKQGIRLIGIFDKNEAMSGKMINEMPIRNLYVLEEFCLENTPKIAILCIPELDARTMTAQLHKLGIKGILNFSEANLSADFPDMMIEDVSFSDSLLALRYYLD
ncbi:MAG: redox-sensing transcriptional repressor Rex [Clostridia bacterium]|nr:redox-sensing transcriptional repressor Rex [Clostridia bacterium]